jgi:ubiquinone/menaquinone biosynthesis C-methylase UbiE
VLESGGLCGILELGRPGDSFLGLSAGLFTKYGVPLIGYLLGSEADEYNYLQDSVFKFPDSFDQQISRNGFTVISTAEYMGGLVKLFIAKK